MKILVVTATICAFLSACVSGSGAQSTLSDSRVSTLTASERLGNSGVTLDPPGARAAKVGAQAAFSVCTNGRAPCPDTSPTAARLAFGTDDGPASADANGNVTLTMQHRLVWAISWSGIECRFRGGAVAESSPDEGAPATCDTVAFVDAATGDFLYQVTYELK